MGSVHARTTRTKLSTTVAPETYDFLERMVSTGKAASIAEAIDRSVATIRQLENRRLLARATSNYFEHLEPRAAAEEDALGRDLAAASSGIDFDKEL